MIGRSKKLLLAATVLVIGLVAFLGWKAASRAEPVYQGRPLTSWVTQWRSNFWAVGGSTDATKRAAAEAAAAIHNTGTDGIQFLLGLMKTEEPAIKTWLRKKIPTGWHTRLHLEDTTAKLKTLGGLGLAALGTNGSPAVPELMRLLSLEMTRNPPDRDHGYLPAMTLGFMGSAIDPAVPLLVECLTNRDRSIRNEAAIRLGQAGRKPEIVVPAVLAYLKREEVDVATAIAAIGYFGTNAISASPTLVAFLNDPNPDVRTAVTNWLPRIDRAASERAGIP